MSENEERQSMFWADQIARSASGAQVVHDAKTPSGKVHVGALRGVIMHDVIYKAVKDAGLSVEYHYGNDDYDPMDSLPSYLPKEFEKYMGMPLSGIPSPDGKGSYSDYYFNDFQEVFESLGAKPKIYKTSEFYKKGKFNEPIKLILENAEKIREIYKRVSGSQKTEGWLPLSVVCDECGKIGTTKAYSFDGELVKYKCEPAMVKWAKGCGHEGEKSPFNGGSKLPWKLEWPSVWSILNTTIEGSGKDHSTVGGARDIADAVYQEIFKRKPPFEVPYEFFLLGGKKMSSSKGLGVTAREISDSSPPELLRFLVVRYKPRTAINFNPDGETIPRLFDDWDKFARVYFEKEESRDPDVPRIFALSQVSGKPKDFFRPQFSFIAFLIQVPGVSVEKAIERYKGSALSEEERKELKHRAEYARIWLEKFAGEEDKIEIVEKPDWTGISEGTKKALSEFSGFLDSGGAEQSEKIRQVCEKNGAGVQEFYKACYKVFIAREKGPRLVPFLNALDKAFVEKRLKGEG